MTFWKTSQALLNSAFVAMSWQLVGVTAALIIATGLPLVFLNAPSEFGVFCTVIVEGVAVRLILSHGSSSRASSGAFLLRYFVGGCIIMLPFAATRALERISAVDAAYLALRGVEVVWSLILVRGLLLLPVIVAQEGGSLVRALRRSWRVGRRGWAVAGCAVALGLPYVIIAPVVGVTPDVIDYPFGGVAYVALALVMLLSVSFCAALSACIVVGIYRADADRF